MSNKYLNSSICFVFKGDISESTAAVNRVFSLAKGLQINNANAIIYGLIPFRNSKIISASKKDNILYSYPKIKSNSFLLRIIISTIDLFFRFPIFIHQNKIGIVHLYEVPIILKYIIILYKLFFKFKVVEENTEFPSLLLNGNKLKEFWGKLQVRFAHMFLDGMVLISKSLLNYYSNYTSNYTKFEIINMTVDISRFENPFSSNIELGDYFTYCGSFSQKKDGIITLIKAFGNIRKRFPDIKLLIIGSGNETENKMVDDTIEELGLKGSIILKGRIPKEEIPGYLVNSIGMVLPRPKSLQAEGGFPTKLGEYLASGNPVIATKVGEIPEFLIDGVNSYLAEPDSEESLVQKMTELIMDYQKAKKIGMCGKTLANNEFNYIEQTKKLLSFYKNL